MSREEIKKEILAQGEFQAPDIQKKYELSYSEMKRILDELIFMKKIEFVSGVKYKVVGKSNKTTMPAQPRYELKSDEEALFIKALWACTAIGCASIACIERECGFSYGLAARAIDWMTENEFITDYPRRELCITREDFIRIFGRVADEEEIVEDDEEPGVYEQHMLEALKGDVYDIRAYLVECFERGLRDINGRKRYVIGFDGGTEFELRFVRAGEALRISDCGKTFTEAKLTENQIEEILKDYPPVILSEHKEVSITIENPLDTLMALLTLYTAVDAVKKTARLITTC